MARGYLQHTSPVQPSPLLQRMSNNANYGAILLRNQLKEVRCRPACCCVRTMARRAVDVACPVSRKSGGERQRRPSSPKRPCSFSSFSPFAPSCHLKQHAYAFICSVCVPRAVRSQRPRQPNDERHVHLEKTRRRCVASLSSGGCTTLHSHIRRVAARHCSCAASPRLSTNSSANATPATSSRGHRRAPGFVAQSGAETRRVVARRPPLPTPSPLLQKHSTSSSHLHVLKPTRLQHRPNNTHVGSASPSPTQETRHKRIAMS
jgi:hypothetical protein